MSSSTGADVRFGLQSKRAVVGGVLLSALFVAFSSYSENMAARAAIEAVHLEGPPRLEEHEQRILKQNRLELDAGAPTPGGAVLPQPLRPVMGVMPFAHRVVAKLGNKHIKEGFTRQEYEGATYNGLRSLLEDKLRTQARKLGAATLTTANTEPLNLLVNWNQFDPSTARKYSTCFKAGDWFYTGPEYVDTPPAAATCTPESTTPCWGVCTSDDVIDADRKAYFKTSVDAAVLKLNAAIRVPKLSGKLQLKSSTGTYPSLYGNQWGWDTTKVRCGADTFYMCQVASDPSYCTAGVAYNAIVYITYNPVFKGYATGGGCEVDQFGRSITMVYNMRVGLAKDLRNTETFIPHMSPAKYAEFKNNRFTALSVHEILHGLGFHLKAFQDAKVVQLKAVYEDTARTVQDDSLWHLIPASRTAKLAKIHFDCKDDAKWHGVPLMGSAESGRDSHHNSFILWDDVESYGDTGLLSPFALAPLEDLGHYLADYSKAEFPNYGAYRGCDFVNTRCRVRSGALDAAYQTVTSTVECDRQFTQQSTLDRCAADGCGSKSACHPECIVLTSSNGDKYREFRPVMNGTGALLGAPERSDEKGSPLDDFLNSELALIIIPVIVCVAATIVMLVVMNVFCGTEERKIRSSHGVSLLFVLLGVGIAGVGGYIVANVGIFGNLLSNEALYALIALGVAIFLQGFFQYRAATSPSKLVITLASVFSIVFLILQLTAALMLLFYLSSLDQVEQDAVGGEKWDGRVGEGILREIENYVCESYRNCCRDPLLGQEGLTKGTKGNFTVNQGGVLAGKNQSITHGNQTHAVTGVCLTAHDGAINTGLLDITDPSRPKFCEYISGTTSSKVGQFKGMAPSACKLLDQEVIGFDQETCQAEYCYTRVEGYQKFVSLMVAAIRRNAMGIGGTLLGVILVQIVQLDVLRHLYKKHRARKQYEENKVVMTTFPGSGKAPSAGLKDVPVVPTSR